MRSIECVAGINKIGNSEIRISHYAEAASLELSRIL